MAVYSQGSGIVHRFSSLFPHHRHVSIISHGMAVILSSRGSLSRITISTAQSISVTFEGLFKLSSHLGCCARVAPGWAFPAVIYPPGPKQRECTTWLGLPILLFTLQGLFQSWECISLGRPPNLGTPFIV